MENRKEFQDFKNIFETENYFVVTSHTAPDGDNIGSSVAMVQYLEQFGKKTYHLLDDEIPENLKFLIKDHIILKSEEFLSKVFDSNKAEKFVLIVLDTADEARICVSSSVIEKSKYIVNIDHHISNTEYGKLNYIEAGISSTSELVCKILRTIDETKFTKNIATALYTGISTDTGNFLFDSVDEDTFENASFLTKNGADRDTVANKIYQSTTYDYIKLTRDSLETLEVSDSIGVMVLTEEMLQKNNVDYKDTDSLVNNVINIEGVRVGILIKERGENQYKISLRSKDNTNVCEIAQKFGGGGHKRAAGCTINEELNIVKTKVLEAAKDQICITDL